MHQEVALFDLTYTLSPPSEQRRVEGLLGVNFPIYVAEDLILQDLNGRWPIPQFTFHENEMSYSTAESNMKRNVLPLHVVPLQYCPLTLIARRLVYLRNGYAFVPNVLFARVVRERFQAHLERKMKQSERVSQGMMKVSDDCHFRPRHDVMLIMFSHVFVTNLKNDCHPLN